MATVKPKFKGVTFDDNSAQILYIITGTTNEISAKSALDGYVDDEFDSKPLELTGISEQITNSKWLGFARYSYKSPVDPEYIQYAFDISVGSQHITQSDATHIYGPEGSAPDTKGAIGVNAKGEVHGCDILMPEGTWSETQYFAEDEMTTSYKHLLRTLVGSVNKSSFKGDAPGECLFIGVSGQRITKAITNPGPREDRWVEFFWEMQFRFATSENRTAANGNPIIARLKSGDIAVDKKGWQYLWWLYETTKVEGGGDDPGYLIEQPVGCYVEDVYKEKEFSLIDIGTT